MMVIAASSVGIASWDWGNSSRHSHMMSVGAPSKTLDIVEAAAVAGAPPAFAGVAFQGFDWGALSSRAQQYTNLASAASDLASAGFGAVWFPPPSKSVDTQGCARRRRTRTRSTFSRPPSR
eukprot:1897577-Prymnesium_polylepis.1